MKTSNAVAEIGRVRSLYLDFGHGETTFPKRGDRLSSNSSFYYVLHARRVKRRDVNAPVRVQMAVMKFIDMAAGLSARLICSAIRNRGGSLLFEFTWNPRKKKSLSFEQLMRLHG